jgi:hypothetical protein
MLLNKVQVRRPYTLLSKVTLVAMICVTLAYASELLTLGLDREVTTVVGILVIVDALVATGLRWSPALAALLAGGLLLGNPYLLYNLSQPFTSSFFLAALVQLVSSLIVVVVGIGATVQNYRKRN